MCLVLGKHRIAIFGAYGWLRWACDPVGSEVLAAVKQLPLAGVIVTARSNRRKVIRAPTEQHPSWPLRLRAFTLQSTAHRQHDRPSNNRASTSCRPRTQSASIKRIRHQKKAMPAARKR